MINLHKNILTWTVIMQEVLCHMCSLRHPVEPNSPVAPINMIIPDFSIYCCMELYSGHFSPAKQSTPVNIMNLIIVYLAKNRSEAANHATREAVQVLGRHGAIEEHNVARLMRDCRVTQIYEGSSDIQRMVIMREL